MGSIKALFFDQDGVIIDTERDGHRVAFNQAFAEFGLDFEWTVDVYRELLRIGGGKERLRHYLNARGISLGSGPAEADALILKLHRRKTEIFIARIEGGRLPLRPGVRRLMHEAMRAGVRLGICTTSDERAARFIAERILADVRFDFVLAGDAVARKKPAPDIYLLALEKSGFRPEACVVIEDSRNGVLAAKAAGIPVVATTSTFTIDEDLSAADIVVTSLGEPGGERSQHLSSRRPHPPCEWVGLEFLQRHFASGGGI
jgi:HAD superfamily hydrolase (TIGR01509 family)